VHDLGKQVPVNTIIDKAIEVKADAIGLSALLVSTSKQMPLCVKELDRRGLQIPVLIGGAAINRRFGRRALFIDGDRPYDAGLFYCKDAFEGLSTIDALQDPARRPAALEGIVAEARNDVFLHAQPPKSGTTSRRSAVRSESPVPKAPFFGTRVVGDVPLDEIFELLDLDELYRLQVGRPRIGTGLREDREDGVRADAGAAEGRRAARRMADATGGLRSVSGTLRRQRCDRLRPGRVCAGRRDLAAGRAIRIPAAGRQ
jgi:cobalamin-dependent methionine synthase I